MLGHGACATPGGHRTAQGFTIIELMVALSIAAVLITIGLPAFNGFLGQQRLTTYTNDLIGGIAYARSEAAKLGGVVSIQALTADNSNEWGGGYCIVAGNPGNCTGTPLRSIAAPTAVTLDAIGALEAVYTLSFNSRGLLVGGAGGAIQVCSTDPSVINGRTVNITPVGRTMAQELTCN